MRGDVVFWQGQKRPRGEGADLIRGSLISIQKAKRTAREIFGVRPRRTTAALPCSFRLRLVSNAKQVLTDIFTKESFFYKTCIFAIYNYKYTLNYR